MNDHETRKQPEPPEADAPLDAERAEAHDAPDTPDEHDGSLTPEEAEELVSLARSGEVDVPVGAEGFVEALRVVAAQRDEHRDLLHRTAADYQNFQRRARQNEREARELSSVGVVQSLLQVLDFFDMALKQDPEKATAAQVIGGVEMIKAEFLRVLAMHGVGLLTPAAGEAFDPKTHEAVENTGETNIEPGHVVETRTPGYTMGERVIRPAKVVVATEAGNGEPGEGEGPSPDQSAGDETED